MQLKDYLSLQVQVAIVEIETIALLDPIVVEFNPLLRNISMRIINSSRSSGCDRMNLELFKKTYSNLLRLCFRSNFDERCVPL